jgi:ABC-type multidrug transport system fused ATPase/permease subunit
MLGACKGPIWRRDDFSLCFEHEYIQIIFPLAAAAVSLALIAVRGSLHVLRQSRNQEHRSEPDSAPLLVDVDEDGEDGSLSDLTLQKTQSHAQQSVLEVDRPRGERFVIVLELLALLAQVALSIVEVANSKRWTGQATASLAGWLYVSTLAAVRLSFSATKQQLSFTRLWNHTACLYAVEWLLQVWVFRSVLIRRTNYFYKDITIAHFALTCLLLAIALCARRGNRNVLLEYDGDIEPSREPIASLLSLGTFSWVDSIVLKGFKKPLELADVWNVTLKDKAELVLARFRQVKKTHGLAIRLLLHFKKQILIQGAWCVMSSIFMFMPTLLLKLILEYLEDSGNTPITAAWLYVVLLFVTGVIQAVGDGQALWIGRKVCIQLRAVIIGEIYSKTLRRKAAAAAETELGKDKGAVNKTFWQRLKSKWSVPSTSNTTNSAHIITSSGDEGKKPLDAMASNGTIINLMSIDSFKVAEISSYLHFLWAAVPVQFIMAVVLLYNVLGLSSLAGIALMGLVLPLNLKIAKSFQSAQKKIMAATDKRIHSTNEVLQNIRIIKYFAWEERFKANVDEKREVELSALWQKYILWSLAATTWSGVPVLITFISFLIYTLVEQKPLVPSVAFPALSMFSLLRIPLDQLADMVAHVQESKVSVDRVEEFLNEEETEKYVQMRQTRRESIISRETRIALNRATLTWGSKHDVAQTSTAEGFRLIDMDVEFQVGKFNIIAGPTGSGKTSLLMALLGEMKLLHGSVHIPGGYVRQELRADPVTGLTESVAYCAQQPWLVNATIKENILFSSPFDAQRYKAVIAACALERDLEILDVGDQTLVGEKGITLSGGQKQRISLARAVYSNSKHLLLDDCLSAVDSHTAKHIFEQALTGILMVGRTCILVSHNIALTIPEASFVVVLKNGKIAAKGSPEDVIQSGALGEEMKSRPGSGRNSAVPSRVHSSAALKASEANGRLKGHGDIDGDTEVTDEAQPSTKQFVDHRLESKATGSVKARTIKTYLQAMGPWYYWVVAAVAFIATQLGSVATNVWIRQWANAYQTSEVKYLHGLQRLSTYTTTNALGLQGAHVVTPAVGSTITTSSPYDVDVGYYLGVYALIGLGFIAVCLARELILFWGSLGASRKVHDRLLYSILRAKFRFFDSTPLGQMTNRFSKDIQSIDQEVAGVAIGLIHCAASVITIVVLISAITPGFLIPGFFIALMYLATGMLYIRSSRDLKRIESVQRSPLFQHFGETLTGVVTIRAYGDEARFLQDSHHRVNTHNRPFIYLWATNRWLAFRMDVTGALVSFFSGVFVILNARNIDAGAAGLALSYAITFTQNVLWLVRLYAANEQNMNSVERIQEYIDVEQEAAAHIPETAPEANWPSRGSVEFIAYGTRYRSDLDKVLSKVTFKIKAGEKVGVVGRTGAGKSSLALALFRGLEAEEGKILIDDVDIGLIGLQDLREAITIVPQDPTLFTGTLRSNLDPFELFTDEEVFAALRRVQLISSSEELTQSATPSEAPTLVGDAGSPDQSQGTISSDSTLSRSMTNSRSNKNIFLDLSTQIAESGSNLSQGQRQLLCLARAMLKSPKVLVMDEATASIDYATDTRIQSTLRELKHHTLITIAHRLQTVIDYDMILVLDKGEVIEYANPWELIQKEGGSFRSMCETSGHFDSLVDLAKKAAESRRLIDDS